MNNKTRAEEHLLPPSTEEDKEVRSCKDPVFDLLIFPYSIKMDPKRIGKIPFSALSRKSDQEFLQISVHTCSTHQQQFTNVGDCLHGLREIWSMGGFIWTCNLDLSKNFILLSKHDWSFLYVCLPCLQMYSAQIHTY